MNALTTEDDRRKLPELSQITEMAPEDSTDKIKGLPNRVVILSKWWYLYVTLVIVLPWIYSAYQRGIFHSLNQNAWNAGGYQKQLEWDRMMYCAGVVVCESLALYIVYCFGAESWTSKIEDTMKGINQQSIGSLECFLMNLDRRRTSASVDVIADSKRTDVEKLERSLNFIPVEDPTPLASAFRIWRGDLQTCRDSLQYVSDLLSTSKRPDIDIKMRTRWSICRQQAVVMNSYLSRGLDLIKTHPRFHIEEAIKSANENAKATQTAVTAAASALIVSNALARRHRD